MTEEYKGRFAIYSNNTSFKIYQVTINNEQQNCSYGKGKNRQIWPEQRIPEDMDEQTTLMNIIKTTTTLPSSLSFSTSTSFTTKTTQELTTTLSSTSSPITKLISTTPLTITTEFLNSTESTQKEHEFTTDSVFYTTISKIDEKSDEKCGISLKILDFKQFQIPYNPGEFPFAVSIFQILNVDKHHYKCAGTIISNKIILTSVNCLLDHNSKLIDTDKLIVYAAQYLSVFRNFTQNSKVYNVIILSWLVYNHLKWVIKIVVIFIFR